MAVLAVVTLRRGVGERRMRPCACGGCAPARPHKATAAVVRAQLSYQFRSICSGFGALIAQLCFERATCSPGIAAAGPQRHGVRRSRYHGLHIACPRPALTSLRSAGLAAASHGRGVQRRTRAAAQAAASAKKGPVVVIDNYDSFTYNLCQVRACDLGAPRCLRAAPGAAAQASTAAAAGHAEGAAAACALSPPPLLAYAVPWRPGGGLCRVQERREDGGRDPRHEPGGRPRVARARCGPAMTAAAACEWVP